MFVSIFNNKFEKKINAKNDIKNYWEKMVKKEENVKRLLNVIIHIRSFTIHWISNGRNFIIQNKNNWIFFIQFVFEFFFQPEVFHSKVNLPERFFNSEHLFFLFQTEKRCSV